MTLGADDYLTKPFTRDDLLGAIQARIQRRTTIQKSQAKHLEEVQQRLSCMVAHELRTPLPFSSAPCRNSSPARWASFPRAT